MGMSAQKTPQAIGAPRVPVTITPAGGWTVSWPPPARFLPLRLQQLLETGAVAIGARTIKDANHRSNGRDYVVTVPPTAPATPQGQDIPLEVVYEDKDLIVINKPAGWWCIPRPAILTARWSTP